MKYKLIYTFSLLVLLFIWFYPNHEVTHKLEQIDSTEYAGAPMDSVVLDTTPIRKEVTTTQPAPTIIYIDRESNTNILGLSNEIITLMIGLGNIITMYYQFKKK